MFVNFEIAALFSSPYSQVEKGGNFKTNIHLVSVESFLYYIILALVPSLVSETNKRCASFELILKCPCVLFLYQTPS